MEKVKYTLADGIEFERDLIEAKYQMLENFGEDEEMLDAFDEIVDNNNKWILNRFVEKSQVITVLESFIKALENFLKRQGLLENEVIIISTELNNLFAQEIEKIFS